MKKAFILTAFILACSLVSSHAQTFSFEYDGMGNRRHRTYSAPSFAPVNEVVEIKTETYLLDITIKDLEILPENEESIDALLKAGKILVYPNPHEGVFTIYLPLQKQAAAHITMYDYTGRQVYHTHTGTTKNIVDISTSPAGTYILKIAVNGQVAMHRVVKK